MYPFWEQITIIVVFMRVIATNTLKEYWEKYPKTEQALKSWLQEVEFSDWQSPQELKCKYRKITFIYRISTKNCICNMVWNSFRI